MHDRWSDIQAIWQSNPALYVIAGFLAGILFFPAINALSTNASDLLAGFVPEAVGIAFTVLLIDRLYQRKERQKQLSEYASKLVSDAGSSVNHVAVRAIEELGKRRWLYGEGSLLQGESFTKADWRGAPLVDANLQQINLGNVNLQSTSLWLANLHGSKIVGSYLEEAWLVSVDLRHSMLWASYFNDAQFYQSHLQYASFSSVDLRGANFDGAACEGATFDDQTKFDVDTKLPDGTFWTPETDMTRFTDPKHPNFWEPDWVKVQRG